MKSTVKKYLYLITLSQAMFVEGSYESAYHFLAAALHSAQAVQSPEYALQVERLSVEQLQQIDAVAPEHKLSTQSVLARKGVNLYQNLANQAALEARILRTNKDKQGFEPGQE